MLLVGNGRVITRDAGHPYLEHGAVAIEGDTIVAVGAETELAQRYPDAEYVDAQGGVIMPGLVNCHTHIYSGSPAGSPSRAATPPTSWRTSSSSGGGSTARSRSTARAPAPTPPSSIRSATA